MPKGKHKSRTERQAKFLQEYDAMLTAARAGDPAAQQQLYDAANRKGDKKGQAGNERLNFLRRRANEVLGTKFGTLHDKSFLSKVGHVVGGALKIAAPIAGALIPGVGTLGAAAIGALGNTAGRALHGDRFNLGSAIGAGTLAAGGNKLLGNGLGSVPATSGGVLPTGPGGLGGDAVSRGVNAGGGGLLGGGGVLGTGFSARDAIGAGLGVAGAFQNASQQSHANDLQNKAMRYAEQDWAARGPLRTQATQRMLAPLPKAEDQSALFAANQVNPFARRQ